MLTLPKKTHTVLPVKKTPQKRGVFWRIVFFKIIGEIHDMFYPQFLYGLSRRRKKRFMMVCLASQVPSLCDQEGEIERHVISPHFCRRRINSDRPPDQQRTLNKVPTELRCRNFVAKHPLGIQIGAKRAKTFIQCVCFPTEIPFCIPPLVVGQE